MIGEEPFFSQGNGNAHEKTSFLLNEVELFEVGQVASTEPQAGG